jgi:hypothetical protein
MDMVFFGKFAVVMLFTYAITGNNAAYMLGLGCLAVCVFQYIFD